MLKTNIKNYIDSENQNRRPRVNFLSCDEKTNTVEIKTNLSKAGGYNHDPNIGWLSSQLFTFYVLGHRGDVEIVEHNLTNKLAQKCFLRPNKLGKLCAQVAKQFDLNVKSVGRIKHNDLYDLEYWKYSQTGEKNGSILLQLELEKEGYKTLFTNHAGCEKSDFLTESGEKVKTPKSRDFGLPDMVSLSPKGELVVIEAETSQNYKKGIKQINELKFKNAVDWFLEHWPSVATARTYLSTFGLTPGSTEYIIGHTDTDGTTTLSLGVSEVYRRERN